ncbi:zf-HC2 domain-containing protein [Streptomyces sp. NPDC050997]|uniref:anti-sigma factor family protein n=1 Tax=Streptomyces sp. NPDC050997 TaxID=3155519 RepID=UPI003434C9D7
MACRESLALGAYLLGALESAERPAVERHLAHCADCRAQLMELAPLVGLLPQLRFEEPRRMAQAAETSQVTETSQTSQAGQTSHAPPARTAPAAASESVGVARAVSRVVRRTRVRRALVACVLAVAAAVSGVGIYLSAQDPRPAAVPSAVRVSAADPATHVTASAVLTPDPTGTSIRLRLTGLPPAVCHLVVHARDGHTETAAGWTSGYATAVSVPGSSSLSVRDIARMDVVTSSGRLLVELRPR